MMLLLCRWPNESIFPFTCFVSTAIKSERNFQYLVRSIESIRKKSVPSINIPNKNMPDLKYPSKYPAQKYPWPKISWCKISPYKNILRKNIPGVYFYIKSGDECPCVDFIKVIWFARFWLTRIFLDTKKLLIKDLLYILI